MSAIGVWNRGVDIVGKLPVEIGELILQKLDPLSLMNAVSVSKKWMTICEGSSRLKKMARRYLLRKKRCILQDDTMKNNRPVKSSTLKVTKMKTVSFQRVFLNHMPGNPGKTISGSNKNQRDSRHKRMDLANSPSKKTNPTRSRLRL